MEKRRGISRIMLIMRKLLGTCRSWSMKVLIGTLKYVRTGHCFQAPMVSLPSYRTLKLLQKILRESGSLIISELFNVIRVSHSIFFQER